MIVLSPPGSLLLINMHLNFCSAEPATFFFFFFFFAALLAIEIIFMPPYFFSYGSVWWPGLGGLWLVACGS